MSSHDETKTIARATVAEEAQFFDVNTTLAAGRFRKNVHKFRFLKLNLRITSLSTLIQ